MSSHFQQELALETYVRSLNAAQKAVIAYDEAEEDDDQPLWNNKEDALKEVNKDFKELLRLTLSGLIR